MRSMIAVAVVLGVLRILIGLTVTPDEFSWVQAYKDAAHLFMGGLFVAAKLQRQRWQWIVFWLLCVLEVAVAVVSRMG